MKLLLLSLVLSAMVCGEVVGADAFRFVVIGDTRPKFESEDFQIFEGLIRRINQREPALVVNLGDLIYGYGILSKEHQWDKYLQAARTLSVPYWQLPGNHDIYSEKARQVYERRFGRFYQSFDHGDCHFVLLNNCEAGRWGDLGPEQLAWLKADLGASKAAKVFVFLHFPVWEPERVAPRYYAFWRQTLHPLFRVSRVQAVFGGHYHSYGPTREYDGIRYFITGGGGAELRPEYRRSGGEHHFLEVRVHDATFDLSVVTDHGELSDAEADVLGGLEFAARHSSRVGVDPGAASLRTGVTGEIELKNPYLELLAGRAHWAFDRAAFQVEPADVSVALPAGAVTNLPFTLKVLTDRVPLSAIPRLEFDVSAGGIRHRFQRAVVLLQRLSVPYLAVAPSPDGRLTDWGGAPWLGLGDPAGPTAEIRAQRSKDTLTLAVAVPKVSAEASEESGFPDALQLGFARRQSAAGFGADFLRLGVDVENGVAVVVDRTPGQRSGGVLRGIQCGSQPADDRRVFEIAIPTAQLGVGSGKEARALVVSLAFPLPEREVNPTGAELPVPNTLAYQARYGDAALVPVHYVELRLESVGRP